MSETFVKVGKIKDAHGIRGELFVLLFAGEAEWLGHLKQLRLVKENSDADPQIFEVKSARPHKNGLIVKSNDIKDRNQAELLKGRVLEVPESFLVSKPGEKIFLREILGFMVFNGEAQVGEIVKFSSNVAQDLLVVKTAKGEFEIPFVEDFVTKIDYSARTIRMSLPVGLLGEEDDAELSVKDGANEPPDDDETDD